jgi:hypothetical protein
MLDALFSNGSTLVRIKKTDEDSFEVLRQSLPCLPVTMKSRETMSADQAYDLLVELAKYGYKYVSTETARCDRCNTPLTIFNTELDILQCPQCDR